MAYLQVENLTKKFDNTEVLKGIFFSMEKGEVLSIIGSSGGGKTTLLRLIAGLLCPDSGKILTLNLNPKKEKLNFMQKIEQCENSMVNDFESKLKGAIL